MAGQPRHVLLLTIILAVPWCRPVTAPAQPGERGSGRTVELTAEQDQWLADHPVIRVAPDPDFAPFEYMDDDGLYQGISADYLNLVESRLGIRFTILQAETWDQVLDWARNGEADLLVCLARTPQRTEYLAFTDPHIKLPGVIIATTESREALSLSDLKGKQVAVVSGYVWQDLLTLDHPDIELIPVPNIATALQMTSFGIVDAMVGDQATTSYFIQQEGPTCGWREDPATRSTSPWARARTGRSFRSFSRKPWRRSPPPSGPPSTIAGSTWSSRRSSRDESSG